MSDAELPIKIAEQKLLALSELAVAKMTGTPVEFQSAKLGDTLLLLVFVFVRKSDCPTSP